MARRAVRIGLVAVGDSVLAVISGVCEDYDADGTKVLSILDLEAPEETTVADEGDFSFDIDAELLKALEVLERAASAYVSRSFTTCESLSYPA